MSSGKVKVTQTGMEQGRAFKENVSASSQFKKEQILRGAWIPCTLIRRPSVIETRLPQINRSPPKPNVVATKIPLLGQEPCFLKQAADSKRLLSAEMVAVFTHNSFVLEHVPEKESPFQQFIIQPRVAI
jgi:hypothetical protein